MFDNSGGGVLTSPTVDTRTTGAVAPLSATATYDSETKMVTIEWVEDTTGDVIPDAYKVEYSGNEVYTNVDDTSVEVDGSELSGEILFYVWGVDTSTGALSSEPTPATVEITHETVTGTYTLRPYYTGYISEGSIDDYWPNAGVKPSIWRRQLYYTTTTTYASDNPSALADDDVNTYYSFSVANTNGSAGVTHSSNGVFTLQVTSGTVPPSTYTITSVKQVTSVSTDGTIGSKDVIYTLSTFLYDEEQLATWSTSTSMSASTKSYSENKKCDVAMPGGSYPDVLYLLAAGNYHSGSMLGSSATNHIYELSYTVTYEYTT